MNTSEKTCFKCQRIKPLFEFYKHAAMADGHLNKCKSCAKDDVHKYRSDNLERVREYDRKRGMLPHRVAARADYAKTEECKESQRKSSARYRNDNKEKRRVIKAACQERRRVSKVSSIPPWLTPVDRMLIRTRYLEARWMTIRSGVKHQVDHIIPLVSKIVCGLHVPWNLRVIPARENAKKSNRFHLN